MFKSIFGLSLILFLKYQIIYLNSDRFLTNNFLSFFILYNFTTDYLGAEIIYYSVCSLSSLKTASKSFDTV